MACDITKGREKQCKKIGGLSEIYIFPFVEYTNAQIVIQGKTLISFPNTTIFRFFSEGSPNFKSSSQEEGGDISFTEELSLTFPIIDEENQFERLLKKDHRVIVRDRNGIFMLLGAFNGGIFSNLVQQTGGSHQQLNGYTINYQASEENQPPFIDNLEDAGFIINEDNFLLLENGDFILTEDEQFILIE